MNNERLPSKFPLKPIDHSSTTASAEKLQIAISGSNGLVGNALGTKLMTLGHDCCALVRQRSRSKPLASLQPWQKKAISIWEDPSDANKLEGINAVVHLAGEPIAGKRWNAAFKQKILDSRRLKTRQLCETLSRLDQKPAVLICASATGIYGNRGEELLTEQSPLGNDFLADVVKQWEEACQPAIEAGIRVVNARLGIVLSAQSGALQQMLTPAKFCGGKLGSGKQWWSWISLDDAVGGLYHTILDHPLPDHPLSGPVNFVSPDPIRNADFAKCLGQVIRRPAIFPAPAFLLRAAIGEMAEALLLASTRVKPNRLIESGYQFQFTSLEKLLRYHLEPNLIDGVS